jgi:predicted component of type VI protein secretion system
MSAVDHKSSAIVWLVADVTPAQIGEPFAPPPARMIAVLSPDGVEIVRVPLTSQPFHVGRESNNDIVLQPDPEQLVSRRHCVLEPLGQRWYVRDLDSRNHVYIERAGERARADHAELLHGDAVCIKAETGRAATARHWRLVFSDPGQTRFAQAVTWLQYYPESETVWVLGGLHLPRRVEAPPKARRMLLYMLHRYQELDRPTDGVVAGQSELKSLLWPEDEDPQRRADSAVANVAWELRLTLGDEEQHMLQTVRDEGYRLVPYPQL